jgi:hypothetical protein
VQIKKGEVKKEAYADKQTVVLISSVVSDRKPPD